MLKELKPIVDKLKGLDYSKEKAALAKVVKVKGSAYRRPGARMLILEDGHYIGAISGGCLEGDALRKARQVMDEGIPKLVTYNTSKDNGTHELQAALGCEGEIEVLIEPLNPNVFIPLVDCLDDFIQQNKPGVLVTIYGTGLHYQDFYKERLLYDGIQLLRFGNFPELAELDLLPDIERVFLTGKSTFITTTAANDTLEVFIEFLKPDLTLYVFGGGYDILPVIKMANVLQWKVIVSNDCEALSIPARFPGAFKVEKVDRALVGTHFLFNNWTAILVMSHNFKYDLEVLKSLKNCEAAFIGLLGPSKRYDKMKEELIQAGWTEKQLEIVYNPLGLDIGAESSDEIALSIVAGVFAAINRRNGLQLVEKEGFIHPRTSENDFTFA